jgi:hypothetical protein
MSNDLIKQESNAVTSVNQVRGFERIDLREVSMPRVKVMQGLSPELEDEDYDFRPGDIIHGLLMEKLPEKFIPLQVWDSRIMFSPRDEGSTILCRADDGKHGFSEGAVKPKPCNICPYGQWDGNNPPACTLTVNVLALFEGYDMPVVIQFANTSWKYGNRFKQMAVFSGGDIFSRKYKLKSKRESNDKGTYYVIQAKPAGLPTEEEYKRAEELYNKFLNVTVVTDAEDEREYGEYVPDESEY